jgi:hypothetical protein
MEDAVVVSLAPLDDQSIRMQLWIVPGFARRPFLGHDSDLLDTTRMLLEVRSFMDDMYVRPFERARRLEASGASIYRALPARLPLETLARTMTPCVTYMILAVTELHRLLGSILSAREIVRYAWQVDLPTTCPGCGMEGTCAIRDLVDTSYDVVCYSCGHADMYERQVTV